MDGDPGELGQVLGVGEHCSVDHCRQIDFLPFKCDCCSRIFCLEHRSYTAHACPKAGSKETTVIVCPLCAKSVRLEAGQDANAAFDAHQRTDCDPSNYDRVHKKPRCPVGGCKEKLTTINAYRCKHCSQRVCLRHRDPGDHGCAEAQAALRQQRGSIFGAAGRAPTTAPSSGRASASNSAASSRPPSAPRAATAAQAPAAAPATLTTAPAARRPDPQQLRAEAVRQYDDPANSVRGTAERRIAQLQQQQQEEQARRQQQQRWPWQSAPQAPAPPQPTPPPPPPPAARPATAANASTSTGTRTNNANPLVPPHLPERCPQCGAAFATVERLIQHVEDFHPSGAVGGGRGDFGTPGPGARSGAAEGPGAIVTNPLRGLISSATTIAGGLAPTVAGAGGGAAAAAGGGSAAGSGGGGGGGAAGREVFRCYHCARTFHDPVLLVQHADRCRAAGGGAVQGRVSSGGGGGGGAAGASKDGCVLS